MIGIQDFLGSFEVKAVFGYRIPGQFQQKFDIVQDYAVIGRRRIHP